MEPWQQQGFASYKAWKQADNKKRYAAKKAALAEAAAVTVAAVAAEAAALTTVGVAASDEPMAQADDVDEDGWPIYNNPVATVTTAHCLDDDHEDTHGPKQEPPPPLPAPPSRF